MLKKMLLALPACFSLNAQACSCAVPPDPIPFETIDANHDGRLTFAEYSKVLPTIEPRQVNTYPYAQFQTKSIFLEALPKGRHFWDKSVYLKLFPRQHDSCGCDNLWADIDKQRKDKQERLQLEKLIADQNATIESLNHR
jgi:hypothetical protein